jgi:hypothetical protein
MAAMDAMDDDDLMTDDTAMPDESTDDVTAYRERATSLLDEIAQQTKQALADAGIDLDIFFLIPGSGGDAILVFGTPADPDDSEWQTASAIVASVVRHAVGLDRSRCRSLACATTHDQAQQNALA